MLRRLTLRHWAWIHFKLAVTAWVILLLIFTPTQVYIALGAVVILVATVTIVGAAVSVVGLVMSAQSGRTALLGLTVELVGLCFMFAGPIAYLITQGYLAATLPDGEQRFALVGLAYVFCAALFCRIVIVAPRRSAEAHDSTPVI